MPKQNFNKVALQHYWNRTSAWVFSFKCAAYFHNTFSKVHVWRGASDHSMVTEIFNCKVNGHYC